MAAEPLAYLRFWDALAQAPYVYAKTKQGGLWISYDDRESISSKCNYINTEGFRGAMVWELSGDLIDGRVLLPVIKQKIKP